MTNRNSSLFLSAFTLSELLIALGVLGVIAALSIPQVFTAVQTAQVEAKAKEAVSAIQQVAHIAAMEDDWSTGTGKATEYMVKKMNFVKTCPSDPIAQGCWEGPDPGFLGTNQSAGILPSGVYVQWGSDIYATGDVWFFLDWTNGNKAYQGDLPDQLFMTCNFSQTTLSGSGYGTIKPGECNGADNSWNQQTYAKVF
jgi:prepilin-type N-terminal cleavage/methylation domain-containing protein